ncbi:MULTISPECIES: WXG100 family type VII secretion target [Streptomyces]|uniref:WXG100 family type VII secretion target n=1 Tax=Streptomyces TaxID=1883 RepID=UPI00167785E3|nr:MULTISPECIES: hypothetical protein [Streptomyces]MBD3580203.1 hypothetical protein [Streptomyces sp. KD18]GGT27308.1 hypothetical protein GCM10010286_60820 [Streptomyces toxytricini]
MATNFEGFTHQQLLAMVKSLNPDIVKTRSTQLTNAAKTIEQIGEALKKYRVQGWEGEAARAFDDWASQAGSATLRLSKFSAVAGEWMQHAAQTMIEVRDNIPDYPAEAAKNLEVSRKFRNDPDAQQLGREAHAKLTGEHQKAIDALAKLAGSYEQSKTQIGKVEIPTFPPPPGPFQPAEGTHGSTYIERPSGGTGDGGYSGGYAPSASSRGGGSYGDSGPVSGRLPDATLPPVTGPSPVLPDRDVGTDLDSVAVLPDKTLPPVTSMPPAPGPGPVAPGPVVPMPPVAPLPPGTGPTLGGGTFNKVPPVAGPPGGGKLGIPPVMPRDTGIIGGRQVPSTTGPTAGLPRGLVVGSEGAHPGARPPVGPGMHPGMGGAHPSGPGGTPVGRRLAMEPGGVIGGARQPGAMPPGVVGRAVPTTGQPFTHGGSGLVRNTPAGESGRGAMGHAGAGAHAPGNRNERQGGERPDYLAEDEETWRSNDRVVPRVID